MNFYYDLLCIATLFAGVLAFLLLGLDLYLRSKGMELRKLRVRIVLCFERQGERRLALIPKRERTLQRIKSLYKLGKDLRHVGTR